MYKPVIRILVGLVIIELLLYFLPWGNSIIHQHILSSKTRQENIINGTLSAIANKFNIAYSVPAISRDSTKIKKRKHHQTRQKHFKSSHTLGHIGTGTHVNKLASKKALNINNTKNITNNQGGKKHFVLVMGILSKLIAIDRRTTIRETWYQICLQNPSKVKCRFFTDKIRNNTKHKDTYIKEMQQYMDLEYMPYRGMILIILSSTFCM